MDGEILCGSGLGGYPLVGTDDEAEAFVSAELGSPVAVLAEQADSTRYEKLDRPGIVVCNGLHCL